ncbi:pyrimidine reductase family protein [Rhodococcus sp. 15-725-2-2b]|jgi:riboflavin biosynthesis pyrimidine reductase|uniref:pyrimidine reductase family protein n=1 Tax=unclassified Rhodococcus (in: high G+C Gram-positive bacteria) TaxID=192944 RepID=UPI0005DA65FA|nr:MULTISPECIES: pyrimidine reductase family protein [unclassified Rhodococcus (in: high G+C Gram-positive bacteria)]AJW39222.1 5-amino-6-(5-phosphoribosylamino)uracil reductase [Rhodococcus sp. B7740]OZC71680.1 pyrimidine reductase family protein [Rhodococcus sp. 06-469-3-2]OZD42469.1 pyrimidine reductase family protein [Rhodococcus sp. 06-1477-1A]OZE05927.1 pyrimidine reductase family protein [Rhodococcus sp. 05-2255-3B1]OZE09136.1 pyrimidine reductase family protein [Rhodococcus sp. 05-2255
MQLLDNGTYFTSEQAADSAPAVGSILDDDAIRALYSYPTQLDRPWIRTNFVASIDGSVTAEGKSAGLGTPADARLFGILRELCDAVLVGAGTARAENYGGVSLSAEAKARRVAGGLEPVPTIVVVTASGSIDADSRLVTDADVQPVVLTSAAADSSTVAALRSAGATVIGVSGESVSTGDIVATLSDLGFRRILCEGGPGLFGQLVSDGAADELCLTTSPMLVAGEAGRIAHAGVASDTPMHRAHVLGDADGTLLTRWVRRP